MINIKKSFLCSVLCISLVFTASLHICGAEFSGQYDAKSVILIEAQTGRVLYEDNADQPLPPASVTKIMTLLLICEAVDRGDIKLTDEVQVSENAASMGGSQVFLKVGEKLTVDEMLKSITVASANDCAVAMAEFISGSEAAFVLKMNERAEQLGMTNTYFENPTGLDDTVEKHLTSARDISIMSRELLKHQLIFDYTTIWMDTIRNGQFGLTNTNKLIRFYDGANGLKTGSTSKAKFCISATAKRDGMQLICVVMASSTSSARNECAKLLLDYGFANYGVVNYSPASLPPIAVKGASVDEVSVSHTGFSTLLGKSDTKKVTYEIDVPESLTAPIKAGQTVGSVKYILNGEIIGQSDITADRDVPRIGFFQMLTYMIKSFLFC